MSEADTLGDFYYYLRNAVETTPQRGQRTYDRIAQEYTQDISGRADLVLFDADDDPVLVVEAKRPNGSSGRAVLNH
jgi:type I site-specific restriction endonuclease